MSIVLLVGSGGREHCLLSFLINNKSINQIFLCPGNAGTRGTKSLDCSIIHTQITDTKSIVDIAKSNKIDLVIVGPEAPLAEGLADELKKEGIACFGPSRLAAEIESSKAFAKDFMIRHNIPTARYKTFTSSSEALRHIDEIDYPIVIKASGLAAGKGVVIPKDKSESIETIKKMMEEKIFGESGTTVVIEEFLTGPEASFLAFSDGKSFVPFPPAQDHKRIFDGDQGPNTGGMGAFAPSPGVTDEEFEKVKQFILEPAITGLKKEGREFVGVIYAGVILTKDGPKCLEYNCRFGDPETQVLLPLLKTDLFSVISACCNGKLSDINVEFYPSTFAATVVAASAGYPNNYSKGEVITGLDNPDLKDLLIFHAGTSVSDKGIVTSGGRVLAITAVGNSLQEAIGKCYSGIKKIHFPGIQYRKDIGAFKLKKVKIGIMGSTRGTDMQAIIEAINNRIINAEISAVISNVETAFILERARTNNIPAFFVPSKGRKREDFEDDAISIFKSIGDVDIILLIGFMRIISEKLISHYPDQIFNVHPSLLPEFAGGMDLNVHEEVLKAGKTKSGCTVHFVTKEVDKGGIVVQMECQIAPEETPETLKQKVQNLEGVALIEVIRMFQQGRLHNKINK